MSDMGHDRREVVRAVFEQHSTQTRHLENQRLFFAIVYWLTLTVVVVWRSDRLIEFTSWPVITLLALLSLFGLVFSLDIQKSSRAYAASAALIVHRYSLDHYLPGGLSQYRQLSSGTSKLFPASYLPGLSLSLWVLMDILFGPGWMSIVIPSIILALGFIMILKMNHTLPQLEDSE
jgi:hypothetical protein